MSQPETMYDWEGEGLLWYFCENSPQSAIIRSLDALTQGEPLPLRLVEATDRIYFTSQRNQDDVFWERQYGITNFVSLATSGEREICVYNDQVLPKDKFIHELAHNLALELYGQVIPTANSDFVAVTVQEAPPTAYAQKSTAEDFAESVMKYLVKPDELSVKCPLRFKVIERILNDALYCG